MNKKSSMKKETELERETRKMPQQQPKMSKEEKEPLLQKEEKPHHRNLMRQKEDLPLKKKNSQSPKSFIQNLRAI